MGLTFSSAEEISNIQSAFLNIGFGARAMGMGGAYTAEARKAYATSWNPAGIVWQKNKFSMAFSSVKLWNIINYNQLAYSYNSQNGFSFGQMLISSGDDLMSETTITTSLAIKGNKIPGINLFALASNLSIGINGKYFSSSFGNNKNGSYIDSKGEHQVSGNASGYGFDLGIRMKLFKNDKFGIIYRNLINNIGWDSKNEVNTAKGEYNEGLPQELIIGYAKYFSGTTVALDWNLSLYENVEDILSAGLEIPFLPKIIGNYIFLRGGYSREIYSDNREVFSMGAGINVPFMKERMITTDLAYQIQTIWKKHNSIRISFCLEL